LEDSGSQRHLLDYWASRDENKRMEPVNANLLQGIDRYIEDLFIVPDDLSPVLADAVKTAEAAGLPAIQVSPNQGKLLYLIAKLTRAERILEIGTLGGYSAIWLARGLRANGRLISLEIDSRHAEVARANVKRAGFEGAVEIRVGAAGDSLRRLIDAGVEPFDLVFIDADKASYVEYLELSLQLSHAGTVILADNVIRGGRVIETKPPDVSDAGAAAFNQAIARHPKLESLILPLLRTRVDGLSISIVREVRVV
jgi:predicted O-methyltransferase YrrM